MGLHQGTRELAANACLPLKQLLTGFSFSFPFVHARGQFSYDVDSDFNGVFECGVFWRSAFE